MEKRYPPLALHTNRWIHSRTQSMLARPAAEAALYGLSCGTAQTMGMLQFLRECNAKANGYATVYTGSRAVKSMASKLGVCRATQRIQLQLRCIKDLVSPGVVQMRRAPTQDNHADLYPKFQPVE